ncbi:hypothetical protein BC826DRAFT_1155830 [Russula brevipes]|nr:hypothetical protein BC826DRAFT_1155830 [Russula brevipes]
MTPGPSGDSTASSPKEASPQILGSGPLYSGLQCSVRLGRPFSCGPVGLVRGLDRAQLQFLNCLGLVIAHQTAIIVQKQVRRRDKGVMRTVRVHSPGLAHGCHHLPLAQSIVTGGWSQISLRLGDTVNGLGCAGDGHVQLLLPREGVNCAEVIPFNFLPEMVNRYLAPSNPVVIHYMVNPSMPPPERPAAWDISSSRMLH